MLPSLFWLFVSIFPFLEPEVSFPISDYENSTAVQALVAQLRVELVPPPLPSPPKAFYTPPQVGKDVSLNPAAVLGSRQTCTGEENNYCFGTTSWSCPSCGLCCTQASDFWCCPTTGAFCCNSAPGPTAGTTGGCCYNGDICGDNGCEEPTVTVTSTYTYWMTAYDYVTQNEAYVETIYSTITVSATTTIAEPVAGRKMVKRTSFAGEARPNTPYTAVRTSNRQPIGNAPPVPTATVLMSPNHDRLELRLLRMGLLVKRVATFTYTVTDTVTSTTTYISSVFLTSTTTTNGGFTTVTALVTVTSGHGAIAQTTTSAAGGGGTTVQNQNTGLTTGEKAGIGIGAAGGTALIVGGLLLLWWRSRQRNEDAITPAEIAPMATHSAMLTPEPNFPNSPHSLSSQPSYGQVYNQGYAPVPQGYPPPNSNSHHSGSYQPSHLSAEYPPSQNYQQYPQQNHGYARSWDRPSLTSTSGPDPSAMPFEVGGEAVFPHEMPPGIMHEMAQPSPIMRVASPVRKPVGSGLGSL